jgi:preprotein translocase subunit SecG
MSLRAVLIVVALIVGVLLYTGKAEEWWTSMTRAATQLSAPPPDPDR